MSDKYILQGREPVLCHDLMTWAMAMEGKDTTVCKTEIGDVLVSTVFLGVDHNLGDGPPLLFETMIFGGPENEYQQRYSTWDEAEAGHKRAVELATASSLTAS